MKLKNFGRVITSPKAYRKGFQLAQQEYEKFLEVKNRLNLIKGHQQLKNGELFLEVIELNNQGDFLDQAQ